MKRKSNGPGRGNRNPSPDTRFKPGNKFPGQGKRKIPASALIKYTATVIAETIQRLQALTPPELKVISTSNTVPALERIMATGLMADMKSGSLYNFERLLARSIGNVPVRTEMTGVDGTPLMPPTIILQEAVAPFNKEEGTLGTAENPSS